MKNTKYNAIKNIFDLFASLLVINEDCFLVLCVTVLWLVNVNGFSISTSHHEGNCRSQKLLFLLAPINTKSVEPKFHGCGASI